MQYLTNELEWAYGGPAPVKDRSSRRSRKDRSSRRSLTDLPQDYLCVLVNFLSDRDMLRLMRSCKFTWDRHAVAQMCIIKRRYPDCIFLGEHTSRYRWSQLCLDWFFSGLDQLHVRHGMSVYREIEKKEADVRRCESECYRLNALNDELIGYNGRLTRNTYRKQLSVEYYQLDSLWDDMRGEPFMYYTNAIAWITKSSFLIDLPTLGTALYGGISRKSYIANWRKTTSGYTSYDDDEDGMIIVGDYGDNSPGYARPQGRNYYDAY